MFDDDYVEGLPPDPAHAGRVLCDDFREFHENMPQEMETRNYNQYLQAHSLLRALAEVMGHVIRLRELTNGIEENIEIIVESFDRNRTIFDHEFTENSVDKFKNLLTKKYGATFAYQFTDGDLTRIQELINELRANIADSEGLDGEHKARLLQRLEKLQAELHKRVSDLDRFWGLVGEYGVVLGKLGNDAKPIVDRIREIAEIVWRTQARTEELPSDAPLPRLENDDESAP